MGKLGKSVLPLEAAVNRWRLPHELPHARSSPASHACPYGRRTMIVRRSYEGVCPWCGGPAGSSEHRHKRTDVVREFGRGPYAGSDAVVIGRGGGSAGPVREIDVQGPGSKQLTWRDNLCARCNNERSQPYDNAQTRFHEFIAANEATILRTRSFSLSEVYGSRWRDERDNLLRYYVKHVVCRVAAAGVLVTPDLTRYLDGGPSPRSLEFTAEIRKDIVAVGACGLWLGDLWHMADQHTGELTEVTSFTGYRWFRLSWVYDERIGTFAHPFGGEVVPLREGYNVHPLRVRAQRVVARLRNR